jgi:thiol-disulfide isomerase/thioredoxin
LLAREVAQSFGPRVRFVTEDLGASPLADRFGIDKYPAVWVDEALVARPEDFYAWGGPEDGKYVPWKEIANRRKFQADLRRLIEIRLAGAEIASLPATRRPAATRMLPDVSMVDLRGRRFTFAEHRGTPVLVELWATWCPPCLETLAWTKSIDPDAATVVAIAFESKLPDVEALVEKLEPAGRVVMATEEHRAAFDGPPAVPTLLIADRDGRIVRVFTGAPKTLHEDVMLELASLQSPAEPAPE